MLSVCSEYAQSILELLKAHAQYLVRAEIIDIRYYPSRQTPFYIREISTLPPYYQRYTEASLPKKCRNCLPKPHFLMYPI